MAADANSAFGDVLGGQPSIPHRNNDREDLPGYLHTPHSPGEPLTTSTYRPNSRRTVAQAQGRAVSVTAAWIAPRAESASLLEEWLQKVLAQVRSTYADQVTPVRLIGHVSVLLVAAVILFLSNVNLPAWDFTLRALPNSAMLGATGNDGLSAQVAALINQSGSNLSVSESLQRAAVPFTTSKPTPAPSATEVQTYIVQPGDTVLGIAGKFGLRPETIQWSNPAIEVNADLIRPGDQLVILPVNGAIHTVTSGDTLGSIANRYKVNVEDIVGYSGNGLPDASAPLSIGAKLIIPEGTKPFAGTQGVAYTGGAVPASARIGSGSFAWPATGSINQRFWSGHAGIDIGAWTGSPVRAADGGYVAVARGGWNAGYGNHVIIDHGNGFVTVYAHLNSIFVKQGESVVRGQQVGSVGNTGNSTGPHLHFEIRYQGVPRNPLNYLQ